MRMRSQHLLPSLVRVAIATNIIAVTAFYTLIHSDNSWASNQNVPLRTSRSTAKFLFIDLQKHWSRQFVEGLLSNPKLSDVWVNPNATGQFQPDRIVTRAELAKLLDTAFANSNVPKITTRLNEPATKAEALVAIARELNLNIKSVKTPQAYLLSMYRDAIQIPEYAIPAIATITQQGLAINYPDPRVLSPTAAITKSELAVLLYQALASQNKVPALSSPYAVNPNRQLWDRAAMKVTRLEVSISKRKVTAFHGEIALKSYPVAVGKSGWGTPVGSHKVLQTIEYPAWENPFTGDVIPSKDPENPLGDRWIGFWTDGNNWSGFHGTPNRASVGQAASHGCIRMYNEDIRELFANVSVGAVVKVIP
jgi:lipoprotein-anchoring transpeptidase ErfK/SrfK